MLTSAHCFSGAHPEVSIGQLTTTQQRFYAGAVVLHPKSLDTGATRWTARFEPWQIRPAHDLALVHVTHAGQTAQLARPAQLEEFADSPDGTVIELALGDALKPQTAYARLIGVVNASSLVPGASGQLAVAEGPSVGPGSSGSGISAVCGAPTATLNCSGDAGPLRSPLIGVLQDANPSSPTLPFGIVPLWPDEHASWLQAQLNTDDDAPL